LLLWQEGKLSIYYAPWHWVNVEARVMLVGITGGLYQASKAVQEAQRCLRAGLPTEDVLRAADAVGSFSGPLRTNLVNMLDGIGVADALGLSTTLQLFGSHHHFAAHASAIDYPLFVAGRNYSGGSPRLTEHPVLSALVMACLGARVAMVPKAVVIPLGRAAEDAVLLLVRRQNLALDRCVLGFPHPSGANGWRVRQFQARKKRLREQIEQALAQ
jgi:hypothetical protein